MDHIYASVEYAVTAKLPDGDRVAVALFSSMPSTAITSALADEHLLELEVVKVNYQWITLGATR